MSQPLVDYRVGGIVVRKAIPTQSEEYLFVTSNSHPTKWIIPAGHVEPGETDEEAAVREVMEEAGVAAAIIEELGRYQHRWVRNGGQVNVETRIFLMDYQKTVGVNPENRRVGFFKYEDALNLNLWEESKLFIQKAHQKMIRILNEGKN